jgi:hypothetical protein
MMPMRQVLQSTLQRPDKTNSRGSLRHKCITHESGIFSSRSGAAAAGAALSTGEMGESPAKAE